MKPSLRKLVSILALVLLLSAPATARNRDEDPCDTWGAPTLPKGATVQFVKFDVYYTDARGNKVENVSYVNGKETFKVVIEYKIGAVLNGERVADPKGTSYLQINANNSRHAKDPFFVEGRSYSSLSGRYVFEPKTPLVWNRDDDTSPDHLVFRPYPGYEKYIAPALYTIEVRATAYWRDYTGQCRETYLFQSRNAFAFTPALASPKDLGKLLVRNQMKYRYLGYGWISGDSGYGNNDVLDIFGILPGIKMPARIGGDPVTRENAFGYTMACLNTGWMGPDDCGWFNDCKPVYGSAQVNLIRAFSKNDEDKDRPGTREAQALAQLTYMGPTQIGTAWSYEEFLTRILDSYKPYGFILHTTPTRTYIFASKGGYFDDRDILLLEFPFTLQKFRNYVFGDAVLNQIKLSKDKLSPRGNIEGLPDRCKDLANPGRHLPEQ